MLSHTAHVLPPGKIDKHKPLMLVTLSYLVLTDIHAQTVRSPSASSGLKVAFGNKKNET